MTQAEHGGDIFGMSVNEQNSVLDFSVNINPLGLSPLGEEALLSGLTREIMRYPDICCRDLKQAVATNYGVSLQNILCGNGATELIYALIRVLHPPLVCVPAPCFSEYERAAVAESISVKSYALDCENGFIVKDWDMLGHLPKGSVIFAGNPNNPDGRILPKEDFLRLAAAARLCDGYLIIDESFADFIDDDISYRNYLRSNSQIMIVASATKFFAVPGLRIGFLFSSSPRLSDIKKMLPPWNVNGPVQLYLRHALEDIKYIQLSKKFLKEEGVRLRSVLETFSQMTVYPGAANFILLRLTNGKSAAWLQGKLIDKHILIRQCGNYKGLDKTFFRVAIRTREENERLLSALREIVS